MPRLVSLRCRIPKDQISYVRYLLEGYEGLVTQTSKPNTTVVTWHIPASRLDEAVQLARALAGEAGMEILDEPSEFEQ